MTTEVATAPGFERRHERAAWRVYAEVEKWTPEQVSILTSELGREPTPDELRASYEPEIAGVHDNLLTTAGLTRIMSLIIGGGGQVADNTHTRLGVGNSSTAESVGQTDLQAAAGSSNRYFMTMDATYPQASAAVITAKATFGSSDGNFVWNEWGIDITSGTAAASAVVGATLLNRKVASLGTKSSGSVWTLTTTITLA